MNYLTVPEYDKFEKDYESAKEEANFLPDMTTKEGYEKSKRISLDAGKVVTAIEKKREETKAPILKKGRDIDAEAKRLKAKVEVFQLPHKNAYKEYDAKIKQREVGRVEYLRQCCGFIEAFQYIDQNQTARYLSAKLAELKSIEIDDNFEEFAELAENHKHSATRSLTGKVDIRQKYENDQAELEKLRKQNVVREQEENEKRIADEAREKAESKALQEKEAEAKRVADEFAAKELELLSIEQKRIDAEKKNKQAQIDADNAKEQLAEQEKQAEINRVEAAKQAQIDADLAAYNAKQDAEEAQARKKAKEAADLAKREANQKHIGKIRKESKEDLMSTCNIDEATAKAVILAINGKLIRNITIDY